MKKHILVVDDESQMTRHLFILLGMNGFEVTQANSGAEALQILESEHFDVVCSDMKMPGMDGDAFLSRVAESYPATRRVMLSGMRDMKAFLDDMFDQGILHGYLFKPASRSEILRLMTEQCRAKSMATGVAA